MLIIYSSEQMSNEGAGRGHLIMGDYCTIIM